MPRFSRKLAERHYTDDDIYYDIDPNEMSGTFDEQDDDLSGHRFYPN